MCSGLLVHTVAACLRVTARELVRERASACQAVVVHAYVLGDRCRKVGPVKKLTFFIFRGDSTDFRLW